jgi:hypothetical protein
MPEGAYFMENTEETVVVSTPATTTTVSVELSAEQYAFLTKWQKTHEQELGIEVPLGAMVRKAVDSAMKSEKSKDERPARSFGDRPSGDRPSGGRSFGDRKPFGDRPSGGRSFGDRKPFGDRPSGGRSFGDRKPFGMRSDSPRRSGTMGLRSKKEF